MTQMLRDKAVGALMGLGRSARYDQIKEGLLPSGVKLGPRAVGWPRAEIEAVMAARIGGATTAEIKALVQRQIHDRTKLRETALTGVAQASTALIGHPVLACAKTRESGRAAAKAGPQVVA